MAKRQRRSVVLFLVVLVVLAAVAYWQRERIWPGPDTTGNPAPAPAPAPDPGTPPGSSDPGSQPAPVPPPIAGKVPDPNERAEALAMMRQGLELLGAGKTLDARGRLADALASGALPGSDADTVRGHLARLADETLFSRKVFPGDPCTGTYRLKIGDALVRVERELKLRVPYQTLLRINRIPDARKIQAGQAIKFIRGPFHAVVSKSRFTMDVYLQEAGSRRMIFVRRLRVGTGRDGSTPVGRWRVALGGKIARAAWTPPSSSNIERKKILWREPGYPLGPKGYWISLEGIATTRYTKEDGYGIHGTNDPASIAKAVSMGCIRLADADIELVFCLLYEKWSTVTIEE